MEDYKVIVEVLGRKFKCKVTAENKAEAAKKALALMESKIKVDSVEIDEKITPVNDTMSMFEQIFGKF